MKKVKLFEQFSASQKVTESSEETGLMVTGRTSADNNKIGDIADDLGYHAEWNHREGYWLFPEEEDMYDELEAELEKAFTKKKVNARFEGIFESVVTEKVQKIACLECDEVNTSKAWEKNNGFCPSCKDSSRGVAEANKGKVHKAAKQGSYPAVVVVVQDGKVIHQEPVSTPEVAPATFNVMQKEYPKATIHLEDKTGQRLFSESVINEAVNIKKVTNLVADLGWEYDRMGSNGQKTYDELCDLLGIKY